MYIANKLFCVIYRYRREKRYLQKIKRLKIHIRFFLLIQDSKRPTKEEKEMGNRKNRENN